MTENKTTPTTQDVIDFLSGLKDDQQRKDSQVLVEIMHEISGESPVMWGSSIIGFGVYHYRYASGREGDWMKIGFSPRKGKISLYITGDANKYKTALAKMGKHQVGKGCIYISRLSDVDILELKKIIEAAYRSEDMF